MTSEHQKKLGAFYTPESVTDTLCEWAIRNSDDKILEPSFGGCNFLTSSFKVLGKLGCPRPDRNIYGFDIDSKAFDILKEKKINSSNFILQDFLQATTCNNAMPLVDIVLGNPPFLPIHKLEINYKNKLYTDYKQSSFKIQRRSSLWIYFIVHSFKFLKEGGRMAWVVPDSISFTNYGAFFLEQLRSYFQIVKLIQIDERFFSHAGTREKTSFLLCEGFKKGKTTINRITCSALNEALNAINENKHISTIDTSPHYFPNIDDFPNIDGFGIFTMGSLFDIRIGIVIGASKLLVLSRNEAEKSPYYPEFVYPILSKGKQLNNLIINKSRLIKAQDSKIYLINALYMEETAPELFNSLVLSIPNKILTNQTFKNRTKLFGYDDFKKPDAFFTFYSQGLPKFVINTGKSLNCTNSIHRLYFKNRNPYKKGIMQFIALQFFTLFFEKEIKSYARQYGNSILKYEPSDAAKIPVILPLQFSSDFENSVDKIFHEVVSILDKGREYEAKIVAKDFIRRTLNAD